MNKLLKNEEDLVDAIRTGGKLRLRALKIVYSNRKMRSDISRFLTARGASGQDAEDLYQDAIITLERKIADGSYQKTGSLHGFLFGIVRMNFLNFYRKIKKRASSLSIDDSQITLVVEQQHDLTQRSVQLMNVFALFGSHCRELLSMEMNGYSMEEIAVQMEFQSAQKASKEKYRCLTRIRKKVQEDPRFSTYLREQLQS